MKTSERLYMEFHMKRCIALFLVFAYCCAFSSCLNTSQIETFENTSQFFEIENNLKNNKNIAYPMGNGFSDALTRVLYVESSVLHYYNKIDNETYIFCFDPLCKHDGFRECIAHKFPMSDYKLQTIEYCQYNDRYYALRGQKLCSFAFDGSDLRIEHSFGEMGDFDEWMYSYGSVVNLKISGKYAFCLAPDISTGKHALMRYDIENKKMETLFHDSQSSIIGYLLADERIYISLTGQYSGLYCADICFDDMELISQDILIDPSEGIFDGEKIYFFRYKSTIGENGWTIRIPVSIVSYSLYSNIFEDIYQIDDKTTHTMLAVTDNDIYFTKSEAISIGFRNNSEEFNYYSKIYRLDKSTGTVTLVYNDRNFEVYSIHFVNDSVLLFGQKCKISDFHAKRTLGITIAHIDKNDYFNILEN